MSAPRIRPFGEGALLVELDQRIDIEIARRAAAIADAWERNGHGAAIPAYASVVLRFDPLQLDPAAAERAAATILSARATSTLSARSVEIPTGYDGADLAEVAAASGMSIDALITAHASREYVAYFLGFMPGFAYLGDLDGRIRAPRRSSPRPRVPAGSVAIADGQTAVYPFDSPGGWQLIGRTDAHMFDADRDPPNLIQPGDRVRFVPI